MNTATNSATRPALRAEPLQQAATPPPIRRRAAKARSIPAHLVRETIDGIAFYYSGYREVLNKNKNLDGIRGDGGLQFFLKDYLYDLLKAGLDRKKYRIGSGELGFHADYRNNMGLDVVVFDRTVLTPDKITTKFVTVPAQLVVEVDVNVELPNRSTDLFEEYVVRKVRSLFAFGTQKVVWVFTKSRMVISATPAAPWTFTDWNQDVELLDGVTMNIAAYVEQEGFNLDV